MSMEIYESDMKSVGGLPVLKQCVQESNTPCIKGFGYSVYKGLTHFVQSSLELQ